MPPSVTSDNLASGDRSALERLIADFRASWTEKALAARVDVLPPHGPFRRAALCEMVKVDLEYQYRLGRRPRVEAYLLLYPELGTPQTVAVDLLHAEVQARRASGAGADLDDYARRFPKQAEALRLMASETVLPASFGEPFALGSVGPVATPSPQQENRPFGKYVLVKKLGEGGMGEVWKALDPKLGRHVALKMPKVDKGDKEAILKRFEREARAVAALEHPRICPVYDFGEVGEQVYLAMAFVEGESLADLVGRLAAANTPMLPQRAAQLVGRVAEALDHAHQRRVIHRDLKPANIMVRPDGTPVVMDFGLARRLDADDSRITGSGQLLGTPAYMPPEQARGEAKDADAQSDIYSLGVILYELLTGQRAYKGSAMAVLAQVMMDEPPKPSSLRQDLDGRLEAICLTAMAKKPEERYPSMRVFRQELAAFLQSSKEEKAIPVVLPIAKPPSPPKQSVRTEPVPPLRPVAQPVRRKEPQEERLPTRKKSPLAVLIAVAVIVLTVVVFLLLPALLNRPTSRDDQTKKPPDNNPPKVNNPDLIIPPFGNIGGQGGNVPPAVAAPPSFTNRFGMKFVRVPKGSFWMGGGGGTAGDKQVTIPDDFYLAETELTQKQWLDIVGGENPSYFSRKPGGAGRVKEIKDDNELLQFPVENVSWDRVQKELLAKLNAPGVEKPGKGWKYRLPTEAEWEYACRGAPTTKAECAFDFYIGPNPSNDLSSKDANFDGKFPGGKADQDRYLERPCSVKSYPANRLGLYDMHGNVWEWCDDLYDGGPARVGRGGSWIVSGSICRAGDRGRLVPSHRDDNLGVRVVLVPIR